MSEENYDQKKAKGQKECTKQGRRQYKVISGVEVYGDCHDAL